MTPERWQQVKELFNAACERAPAERAAFLDAACAGDADLRREVVSLLAAHEESGQFMERPLAAIAQPELPPTAELNAGHRIGPYQIERRLGAGGMGVVYRAHDARLGRPVALKLLQARFTQDPTRVRRFQQEARAASALNHPNILTIHEVGQENETHFIATEFVDGQTLRTQSKSGGLPLSAALDVLIQAAGALVAAHQAGIIHRDIKPENIMLRRDGIVKVLDFGLAKLIEQAAPLPAASFARVTTQPGLVMGTLSYMSPEQARGLEVDARSDLFSLGVVMYELLTGHQPFVGQTNSDVLLALLSGEPRPLTRYVPELPSTLQEIVNRLLAKPLAQRYQTARALSDDLKRLKEELEFAARLKGHSASQDPLLTMTVGAATAATDEATFTTRAVAAPSTNHFTARLGSLRRYARPLLLAAAALVLTIAGVAWGRQWLAPRGGAIDKVAVLPFANAGNDPQLEYLSDGLTESLINSLSQLPGMTVMARSTVFTYKGRATDPREVGHALGVRAVVTGRVEQRGATLLVATEVVNTADGARLWGAQHERPFADLLFVQEQIARAIGAVLRPRPGHAEDQQLAKRYTDNSEAYQLYLRGRHLTFQGTRASYEKALEHYHQAIALDPRYALAYTGISNVYADLSGQFLAPSEAVPMARQAALTALVIDESLAEAHHAMAMVKWWGDWDWPGAEREFKRALELNPNLVRTRESYASFLATYGRFAESQQEARRTLELDPLSRALGTSFFWARQYDQALEHYRKALELTPDHALTLLWLGRIFCHRGEHQEAISTLRRAAELSPHERYQSYLGYAYALGGQRGEARKILQALTTTARQRRVSPVYLARIHLGLGEKEQALGWLRKAYDEHSDHLLSMLVEETYDPLRDDPRFTELLRGVGLAP